MKPLMLTAAAAALTALLGATAASSAYSQAPTEASASAGVTQSVAEARADALLAQMTLEEKVGQISQQFMFGDPASFEQMIREGRLGSGLFVTDPSVINRLQRVAVEESRLGIPLLFAFDVIHGFRTIFPVPIGLAASWNPDLVEDAQAVAAREARASGIHMTFAPMLDVTRDPRWGRIVEGPGEDPYLASRLAAAHVRGFQGEYIGAPGGLISGPKHFAAYGASEGGRDYDSTYVSDTEFYNLYLPPFAAAVEAGAGNIMSAYQEYNDVPAAANNWLLNDVLRGELGFEGFVVSDANGVNSLVTQGFAHDTADAAVRAVAAGNDMEMATGENAFATLVQAVREGRIEERVIDQAARRVLVAKIRMGLFENPYVDEARAQDVMSTPAHREVAQRAAEQSLVLLQNEDGALPLDPAAHARVAVIGPMADSPVDTVGNWVFVEDEDETVTIFDGVRDRLEGAAAVTTAPGVQLRRGVPSMFEMLRPSPPAWSPDEARAEFDRALDLAREADLVILVVGENQSMSGEGASRATLDLPGDQLRLIREVAALGKPVVAVLVNGRPLDIAELTESVPAVLSAWHPGTRGGAAIAGALFGDVNPAGRLPMTWPRSVGQVPIYYNHNLTKSPDDQERRYWDEPSTPFYVFGHGLSYTTFAYSDLSVSAPAADGQVQVSAVVTNTGDRAGDEVVQLYVHQRSGRATRPVRELKGFERITLNPGESRRVAFTLGERELRYWSAADRAWIMDARTLDVWIGGDSRADLQGEITMD